MVGGARVQSKGQPQRRKLMPKKVTISLHGIVRQIKIATKKLEKAEAKAITAAEAQQLASKVKNLKAIEVLVIKNCPKSKPSYGIVALVK
jgi:hypothetical protein